MMTQNSTGDPAAIAHNPQIHSTPEIHSRATSSACPMHGLLNWSDDDRIASGGRVGGAAMFAYGVVAYLLFVATFLYAIGFVAGVVVPKGIDDGTVGPAATAIVVNVLLLSLFAVQHTIMARPAFKRWWIRIVPEPIERSTFVIAASLCLLLLFWLWRPLPEIVWNIELQWLRIVLWALSALGWVIALGSTFMVSHTDLFGLRQVAGRLFGVKPRPIGFRVRGFYRLVRHPLMVGFIIAFWATPQMSVGHLLFAIVTTLYIFVGTAVEERDLIAYLGDDYREYSRRVHGFIPLSRRA